MVMALGVVLLAVYTVTYVETKSRLSKAYIIATMVFFLTVVIVLIINIFNPILFLIADDCGYYPGIARYYILGVQIILLFLTATYAYVEGFKKKGIIGKRYLTIGLFGTVMLISISIQMYFPLLPLYSIGYMLGSSLLRTFIIENEKEEYRVNLEVSLEREKRRSQELKTAWELAYTDALTGVESKLAYLEVQEKIDDLINDKKLNDFALVVFDINNLKKVNDTLGHQEGDRYIVSACALIKDIFKNSKVFRIGGDEFLALLDSSDYAIREELLNKFNKKIEENIKNNDVVISSGLADYIPEEDKSFKNIFDRADFSMYDQKKYLKSLIN
jgi:diguanylate cyclase (GGDEF)-like protein